jgi:IS1 family transposase
VFKKQEHCDPLDPTDDQHGDWWDHMALDPETRLVLAVVPGARDAEAVEEVVGEVKDRTGGRVLELATSDDYPAYETALLDAYGREVATTATGRPVRKMVPDKAPPAGMNYATVEKRREKGRVVEIITRVVFGTLAAVQAALANSKVSRRINTSFLERQNATDRHHTARKVRKTYTFSEDWTVHEAMTYFTMYSYNFC